jgi:hypothetical protein
MRVRTDDLDRFGGLAALQARVAAFKEALEAHKNTTGVPAPVEASLVELLARTNQKIEAWEPPPARGSPPDVMGVTNQMNDILQGLLQRIQQLEFSMDKLMQIAQIQMAKENAQPQVQALHVPMPPETPKP